MIDGFEIITAEISDHERDVIVPVIARVLASRAGAIRCLSDILES